MNERRSELYWHSGIRVVQRHHATAYSSACFEYDDILSCTPELARSHQSGGTSSNDDYIGGHGGCVTQQLFRIYPKRALVGFRSPELTEDVIKRNIAIVLSVVFMLVMSALGGLNGIDGLDDGGTILQRSVPIASVIYAACGLLAAVGVLLKRPWSFPMAILWALATTYTGSVASIAWAERGQPILISFVSAALLCIVICGLVLWGVRIAVREPP